MDRYTLYAVNLNAVADVLLDQVTSFGYEDGVSEILQGGSGSVDPTYVAVGDQKPKITFSTTAIATVLGYIGIDGLKIATGETYTDAQFFLQLLAEGGTRTSGANHRQLTMNEGMIVPTQIKATHNQPATIDLLAIATYDGSNEPFALTATVSLPGTPAVGELFTAGKVMINGVELGGVQDITIDFGLKVETFGGSGSVWPTYCAIMDRQPLITITTQGATDLATFGLDGTAQGATDSIIYLRKLAEGGTRTADVTAEHISFTIDEGLIRCQSLKGAHNEVMGSTVVIRPTYDGSNAIMVISAATAIA